MSAITMLGLALCVIFSFTPLMCYLSSRPFVNYESDVVRYTRDQAFTAKRFRMICLNVALLVISCFISYFGTL